MLNEIKQDTQTAMDNAIGALENAFKRIRTGRANPNILDNIRLSYYGTETALSQMANIMVEDARTLAIVPWEKNLVGEIEKAIMKSDLGFNPSTNGDTIRIRIPALTEETRRDFIKAARAEAEKGRVSVRNARRDANATIKDLVKDKDFSEDEGRAGEDQIQKLTDSYIEKVDALLKTKEEDLLKV